ncbi:hypothetical protein ET495_08310 [Xylanimonas allomyrinae]|uniref:Uncharacterized protein n=1 Tax=Xylanimonas allomyrinae TaxID=2509459 RepID=A0A4P6ES71_9MICO|nr:hypothetical protein [Xylanimonas allomyrinae]QAY63247.1 hypothetical protein ET495_08310 [Xylanimonas allomyrinae]
MTHPLSVEHYATYARARSALRALDLGAPTRPLGWGYRDVVQLLDLLHLDEGITHIFEVDAPRPDLVAGARTAITALTAFGKPPAALDAVVAALDAAYAAELAAQDA